MNIGKIKYTIFRSYFSFVRGEKSANRTTRKMVYLILYSLLTKLSPFRWQGGKVYRLAEC